MRLALNVLLLTTNQMPNNHSPQLYHWRKEQLGRVQAAVAAHHAESHKVQLDLRSHVSYHMPVP
jgi:hypothetical protein